MLNQSILLLSGEEHGGKVQSTLECNSITGCGLELEGALKMSVTWKVVRSLHLGHGWFEEEKLFQQMGRCEAIRA